MSKIYIPQCVFFKDCKSNINIKEKSTFLYGIQAVPNITLQGVKYTQNVVYMCEKCYTAFRFSPNLCIKKNIIFQRHQNGNKIFYC